MRGRRAVSEIVIPLSAGAVCFAVISLLQASPIPASAIRAEERIGSLIDFIRFPGENTGALVKALLLGRKEGLSPEIIEVFRKSGASHLLALSGLHLGFIYAIVRKATAILGNYPASRVIRSALTISFSVFYTLMTGAGASIVRAMLFIVINETAGLDPERKPGGLRTLAGALTIQLVCNPGIILSVGFQLSYLAMCGIFLVGLPLQKWYPASGRFDPMKKIWDMASVSIGCQMFTAPLVWYYFHSFPVHFLLTNLLALPVTEVAMALAMLAIAAGAAGLRPGVLSDACAFAFDILVKILGTVSGSD